MGSPPPAAVGALPARSGFDAYGINCHFSFRGHSSWGNTEAAVQWLLELGVGAIRQYLPRTVHGRAAVRQAMKHLNANGVRWCCPVLQVEDATSLVTARAVVNDQLDWLEANADLSLLDSLPGPNEPNGGAAVENWAEATRWAMEALWEETRKRPAFKKVVVQGPPLNMKEFSSQGLAEDVASLGDLSKWINRGDVHLYPADKDPEYRTQERLAVLEPLHRGKQICVSESGYSTKVDLGYSGRGWVVPHAVASLYAPKHILVHVAGGRQFFSYELLDEPPPYTNTEQDLRGAGYGLVETPTSKPQTWRPKPGFEATRRLLNLLRDVEGSEPASLRVQVNLSADALRSVLLHRSDGKHLLAIWQAVDLYEWDRSTLEGRYLPVEELPVTIILEQPMPISVFEPSMQDTPTSTFTAQTFMRNVGAGLQVLRIG